MMKNWPSLSEPAPKALDSLFDFSTFWALQLIQADKSDETTVIVMPIRVKKAA